MRTLLRDYGPLCPLALGCLALLGALRPPAAAASHRPVVATPAAVARPAVYRGPETPVRPWHAPRRAPVTTTAAEAPRGAEETAQALGAASEARSATQDAPRVYEGETIEVYGSSGDSYVYRGYGRRWHGRRWGQAGHIVRRRAVGPNLMQGFGPGMVSGAGLPSMAEGLDRGGCEVFPVACGMPFPARRRVASGAAPAPASVTRAADRFVLDNGVAQLSVSTAALCAMTLRNAAGLDEALTFDRPERATGCVVEAAASPWQTEGDAVSVRWTGPGVSQRTVVALHDGTDDVDFAAARTDATGTHLVNLGEAPLVWTLDGEEVPVAPHEVATVAAR